MTKRFCMEYLHDKVIIRDKQRKGEYNFYTLSDEEYSAQELINTLNEQDERIQQLEESLRFYRDLLHHTNDSKRMKQLHDELNKVVTDD